MFVKSSLENKSINILMLFKTYIFQKYLKTIDHSYNYLELK